MKFLHVTIPSKRMMETYIKMIRENYSKDNHTFYFLGKCPSSEKELFKYGNVIELDEGNSKLEKIYHFYKDLNNYDYIIWHGLVLTPKFVVFLNLMRRFLKKSIWVMWGIDLYEFNRKSGGLKSKILNYLNYNLRKNIYYPVAIFPTDIEMYKNIFKSDRDVYYAPYPIREKVFYEMENLGSIPRRENGEVWIQVGNNANSFNNHIEILEKLKRFSKERIKIFIPMSYGNDWHNKENNYIDIVREKAIEIFGVKKIVVLKNLMTIEEYSKYLEQIDIMIIATNRQNALGNILKNMYSGGKIFLSERNILFKYFNSIGIKIFKYEDIDNMSFEDFIKISINDKVKYWMVENQYPKMNLLFWNALFRKFEHQEFIEIDYKKKNDLINSILKHIRQNSYIHEKKNFVNYSKYQFKNKKMLSKIYNAKDVFVVGHDDSCIKVIQNLLHDNNIRYRWNIMGIISSNMVDLKNKAYGINTVATINNCKDYSNVKCINFTDDPKLREAYYQSISKHGGLFESLVQHNASIGSNFEFEEAFFLGVNSIIGHSCKFGKFVKIGHNVVIGCNCVFGSFVTIGDNKTIEDGTILSDYSIV